MAQAKETTMVLNVDLQCTSCYKKVKKLLCKFPQIRNQIYDEKLNTVTITVICCSPEEIRDKLRDKGGKTIKGIEIKPPPKPEEPKKPQATDKPKEEKPKSPEKPKEGGKPKAPEKESEKPKAPEKTKEPEKSKSKTAEKAANPPAPAPAPEPAPKAPEPAPMVLAPAPPQLAPMMQVVPVHGYPSIFPYEAGYEPCYASRAVGPFYHGYGKPEPYYDNYGYSNYSYGPYGGGRPCYVSRYDYYQSEENTPACTIM